MYSLPSGSQTLQTWSDELWPRGVERTSRLLRDQRRRGAGGSYEIKSIIVNIHEMRM